MSKTVTTDDFLAGLFDSAQEGLRKQVSQEVYEQHRRDFVFHLSDARPDLERLIHLLNHPENYDEETATRSMMAILYHVIPHLRAAGKLLLDEVPDAFAD
jgi:hypothetical protein